MGWQRYEDWRAVQGWVESEHHVGEGIYLAPGLVETVDDETIDQHSADYLTFALHGLYRFPIGSSLQVLSNQPETWPQKVSLAGPKGFWIIARLSNSPWEEFLGRMVEDSPNGKTIANAIGEQATIRDFGEVQVIHWKPKISEANGN